MSKLTVGSLFTGIGGFDLGFQRAGMEIKWMVEIDDYCIRVLEKHWPDVRRYKDVKEVHGVITFCPNCLPPVDLICGGFPCQPVSVAGKRKAQKDERWLWPEFARIIREIQPRWVVIENVRGLLSVNNGGAFTEILRDLASCGYDAEWRIISACEFGAPHTRERVFIVAYPAGYRQQGDMREIIPQTVDDLSLETLDIWHGASHPFANIQERMASPGISRIPDGVSSTLAIRPALRGYGNAVVPQVAEFIGRRIMEAENGKKING